MNIGGVPPAVAALYAQGTSPAAAAAPAAATSAVRVETMPASPPPEVHAAIADALTAPDRLAAANRELRFKVDERTGHVQVEVHDLKGHLLFTAPPSKALDVAAGGGVD